MSTPQPGILAPIPAASRHLFFHVNACHDAPRALQALRGLVDGFAVVVGIGAELAAGLDAPIPGLRPFPSLPGARVPIPYVPYALWCWLRGSDRGELFHTGREIENALAGVFTLELAIDCFCHRDSRDLTGYEDGTENPVDEAALAAAIVSHEGDGLDGGSFASVQQWLHDIERFQRLSPGEQDDTVGRSRIDNEELEDAPDSAHVKRTAQEDFDPPAFMVRRSMPWTAERRGGLVFLAFGHSPDAFEAVLRRMSGAEDDIHDALFNFTRPLNGAHYWCPPLLDGRPDWRALGI